MTNNSFGRIIGIFWVLLLLNSGCTAVKTNVVSKDIRTEVRKSAILSNQLTGFSLYDPQTDRFLASINDDLYFTPASNMKILTALAVIQRLRDSIPSLLISRTDTSLIVRPMADPTFLHPDFPDSNLIKLFEYPKVQVSFPNQKLDKYGPGWAWEDYQFDFQPERSWFPIYGNVVSFIKDSTTSIQPNHFKNYMTIDPGERVNQASRDLGRNIFRVWVDQDTGRLERKTPFINSKELYLRLLHEEFGVPVEETLDTLVFSDTIYSQPTSRVLAQMMLVSDNFLAEQLLLQAGITSGNWNPDSFRNQLLAEWQSFLPDPVFWVDGSGLSRYNMVTPRSLVKTMGEIYKQLSWDEIEQIFPVGGVSGTIKNYYKAAKPYIVAKTGTLRNNHSLTGFLITKSGRTLIFSFMNNHYTVPVREVKKEMETLLAKIRDAY